MRKILAILLFFCVFLFLSLSLFAQEKDKDKDVPWYLTSPKDYSWSPYPPNVWDSDYLDKYNRWQQYNNSIYRRYHPGPEPIVIQQPRSPLGAFLDGVGKGLVQSFEYSYRRREQEKYIEGMVKLIELRWQSRKKRESKLSWLDNDQSITMSRKEKEFNRKRIKELDQIIKNRKLNEYLKSKGRSPVAELPEGYIIFSYPKCKSRDCGRETIYWNGSEWVKK